MQTNNSLEDEPPLPQLNDVATRKKSKEKANSMKMHFNYFYTNYYLKHLPSGEEAKCFDDLRYQDVTVKLCEVFANYLASKARCGCNENSSLLKMNSIMGYFSSFRQSLKRKFNGERTPIALEESRVTKFNSDMHRVKLEIPLKENQEIYSGCEAATDKDQKAFTAVCFWQSNMMAIQFLHLFMSTICNVGRGSEV
jgi:hypothetical protein